MSTHKNLLKNIHFLNVLGQMQCAEGTTIGPYVLLVQLGSGSFATVWMAEHNITKCKVAIKIVMKSTLDTKESTTRFTREISLLKKIDQPFIAELFEVIENEHAYFLVMEYIEHGNMLNFVNTHGRLAEDKARRYFCEIVSALDYLHNKLFIAHRDLKAENVLLDRYDNIRLIDFGLSNAFSVGSPTLKTACGSPAYAAPEMIQGCTYTKAADMWSIGILLFAMVAGRLPFDDANVQTLLMKVVYSEPQYPSTMSHSLVDLLKRLLAKNPENRLTIQKLREHPWFSQSEYQFIMQYNFHDKAHWMVAPTIDRDIVATMTSHGLDCHDLPNSIISGDYNDLTSIYRHLRRSRITEQMKDLLQNMQQMAPMRPPAMHTGMMRMPTLLNTPSKESTTGLKLPSPVNPLARRLSRPVAVRKIVPAVDTGPIGSSKRLSIEIT